MANIQMHPHLPTGSNGSGESDSDFKKWLKEILPTVATRWNAFIFGILSLVLFVPSFVLFASTDRSLKKWNRDAIDRAYIATTSLLGFVIWVCSFLFGLVMYYLMSRPVLRTLGWLMLRFALPMGLAVGAVYMGMLFEDVKDFRALCLLLASVVCGITAFRDLEDPGVIDSILGVALCAALNIHGNIRIKHKGAFNTPWHIQIFLTFIVIVGRNMLPWIRDRLINLFTKPPIGFDIEAQTVDGQAVERGVNRDAGAGIEMAVLGGGQGEESAETSQEAGGMGRKGLAAFRKEHGLLSAFGRGNRASSSQTGVVSLNRKHV